MLNKKNLFKNIFTKKIIEKSSLSSLSNFFSLNLQEDRKNSLTKINLYKMNMRSNNIKVIQNSFSRFCSKQVKKDDKILEIPRICNIYTLSQLLNQDMFEMIKDYNRILNVEIKEVFEYLPQEDLELFLLEKDIDFEFDKKEITQYRRPAVVTIMGHVDHGKTTLLDALRDSNISIVDSEFGAITQSIGAFNINIDGKKATFIDTPGHEAFAKMRLKGAKITDLIILVVSGVEGLKKQTIEVLDIIKSNKIPVLIAINKFDLPDADLEYIEQQLAEQDVALIHGDPSDNLDKNFIKKDHNYLTSNPLKAPYVCISAKQRINLDVLKRKIISISDLLNPQEEIDLPAQAYVIESQTSTDKKFNVIKSSVIVKKGVLKHSDIFLCGTSYGKIRVLKNDKGEDVQEAYPGEAVELTGFKNIPSTGSMLCVLDNIGIAEKIAEDKMRLQEYYSQIKKENKGKGIKLGKIKGRKNRNRLMNSNNRDLWEKKIMENLNSIEEEGGLSEIEIRETYLLQDINTKKMLIRVDTEGVLEALYDELSIMFSPSLLDRYIEDMSVGSVTEEDLEFAKISGSVLFTFNNEQEDVLSLCSLLGVGCRSHKLIFQMTHEIREFIWESALKTDPGNLEYVDIIKGKAIIKEVFNGKHDGKNVKIAGVEIEEGSFQDSMIFRISNDISVKGYNLKLASLKQNKQDIKVVREGEECGIIFDNFNEIEIGDTIMCYEKTELTGISESNTYKKCYL